MVANLWGEHKGFDVAHMPPHPSACDKAPRLPARPPEAIRAALTASPPSPALIDGPRRAPGLAENGQVGNRRLVRRSRRACSAAVRVAILIY
ncbi:hypothetical protein Bra471DRAFT_02150 [Bradyrhizobium sp. WSM471]|nr:hypothetical protein Bra471DRAFT_02150 [Bradyrhizobium sp. WSM471]